MNKQKKEKHPTATLGRLRAMALLVTVGTLIAGVTVPAFAGQVILHNTPSYVTTARNLGAEDPAKIIEVSIWLQPRNRSGLDQLAHDLYDKTSPEYRHWLKSSDIAARFAPTAENIKTVREFFESHNLKVVNVGPNNFFVRARGTVSDVQAAFQVQMNKYLVHGETLRSNDRDPYVDGDAAALVQSIAGLESGKYSHPLAQRPTILPNGKAAPAAKLNPSSNTFFSSACFTGVKTENFTGLTSPANNSGEATYKGNGYYTDIYSPGCAYTPPEIYTAYNLNGLYAEGYSGKGQTIVIIDWCGSVTIRQDANTFSARFGLPLLTSSNFSIIETPTLSTCAGPDPEINIDVEWAHAIAPAANIDLVVPPSASFQDVDQGVFYAVNYQLGNTLSGSYGSPESLTPPTVLSTENLISEIAATLGISTNFSTGDDGDFSAFGIPATVSAPADSPYATGVGGVSLALTSTNAIAWQAGWGTDETLLNDEGTLFDPPLAFGFNFGTGGGASGFFSKPSFQSGLPGSARLLPDISWLADPFTGAVIFLSNQGETPTWYAYGGTSLAAPMFSGLWALANEEAGVPLGQAAAYVYSLPSEAIFDIVPLGSTHNVTATIKESSTVTNTYTASEVMGGATPAMFYTGLWNVNYFSDLVYAISFGTDCSLLPSTDNDGTSCNTPQALQTAVGWDDVTGVGTPNGQTFADAFKSVK
jgi:subtilase family serine protease